MKIKSQKVLRKIYTASNFMTKIWKGKANIPPAPLSRDRVISLHYLHKSYLHKKFILVYIRVTKLLEKNILRSLLKNLVF